MSRELPYYQFEVAEYLAGDIMICSLEAQGLFTIIKALYWQRGCELSIKQVLKRHNEQKLIDELIEENCIKINKNGDITIDFLLSQYQSFKQKKEKLSKAGKKGGLKSRKATLKPTLSHPQALRGEEMRGEKKREDDIREDDNDDTFISIETLKSSYLENEKLINAVISVKKNMLKSKEDISKRLEQFNDELKSKSIFQKTWNDYTSHFLNWHRKTINQNNNPNVQTSQKIPIG